ncbi:uncharacterized protein [Branchiostoma lanceolatum]|uniref:uncharacterized protein n=1 Tax=Branchiostoma lanceolatum TaxID=7740 RepID=UPI003453D3C7
MMGKLIALAIVSTIAAIFAQIELNNDPLVVTKDVVIKKNRSAVFGYVSNLRTYPSWYPGLVWMQEVEHSNMKPGKRFIGAYWVPVIGELNENFKIVAYDENKKLAFESDFFAHQPRIVMTFQDEGKDRTRLTWKMFTQRRSYFFFGTFFQIFKYTLDQRVTGALLTLRGNLQGESNVFGI